MSLKNCAPVNGHMTSRYPVVRKSPDVRRRYSRKLEVFIPGANTCSRTDIRIYKNFEMSAPFQLVMHLTLLADARTKARRV
jgi:hypothetical protein